MNNFSNSDLISSPSNGKSKIQSVEHTPTVVLLIGMAGSGKTTFMQQLNAYIRQSRTPSYLINLDPAALHVAYNANIDIRDTINYIDVMKQYNLGPNGSILTSLNLFATKFEQVIRLCENQHDPMPRYIFVDTPGQIEVFTWSASGSLITESFASTFPTVVAFLLDTPRCQNPKNFISNMLQACSILYKNRLPLVLVFNKCDIVGNEFALNWMKDYNKFHTSLTNDDSYSASLSRSLSLVLEEFYQNLAHVNISALTGLNLDRFIKTINIARKEYFQYYLPDLMARKKHLMSMQNKHQVQ